MEECEETDRQNGGVAGGGRRTVDSRYCYEGKKVLCAEEGPEAADDIGEDNGSSNLTKTPKRGQQRKGLSPLLGVHESKMAACN